MSGQMNSQIQEDWAILVAQSKCERSASAGHFELTGCGIICINGHAEVEESGLGIYNVIPKNLYILSETHNTKKRRWHN
jgi:hypothetical protein